MDSNIELETQEVAPLPPSITGKEPAALPEGRARPPARTVVPLSSKDARLKVVGDFKKEARSRLKRLHRKAGLEALLLCVVSDPKTEAMEDVTVDATAALMPLNDVWKISDAARHQTLLSRSAAAVQTAIAGNINVSFDGLDLPQQRQLVKWLLARAIFDRRGTVPFGTTTAEQVKERYSWYPDSVQWISPRLMQAGDLPVLFRGCVLGLKDRAAEITNRFRDAAPLGSIAATQLGAAVLQKSFAALNNEPDLHPEGVSGEFVTVAGRRMLGHRASVSQILQLFNEHRTGNKRTDKNVGIQGTRVSLEAFYNRVQARGGWGKVKASTASQNELLVALGCAAPNCSSRSALKGAWEKYLEPICGVANPHAAAGAPEAHEATMLQAENPGPADDLLD